jgi:hypothetical protein
MADLSIRRHSHQSKNLWMQFLVSEYFSSWQGAEMLVKIASEKQLQLDPLHHAVGVLLGSPQSYGWKMEEGCIAKLRYYSLQFCQHNTSCTFSQALQQDANQAWLACLMILDFFHLVKSDPLARKHRSGLKKSCLKLQAFLHSLGTHLQCLLQQFPDENILFFMLRHKKQFDTLFGENYVAALFNSFFPQGEKEALEFLQFKYAERGFENLIPVIENFYKPLAQPERHAS